MKPRFPPLFAVGQLLYLQRKVRTIDKGEKVKVLSIRELGNSYRYQVERDKEWEWCFEYELGKHKPE